MAMLRSSVLSVSIPLLLPHDLPSRKTDPGHNSAGSAGYGRILSEVGGLGKGTCRKSHDRRMRRELGEVLPAICCDSTRSSADFREEGRSVRFDVLRGLTCSLFQADPDPTDAGG